MWYLANACFVCMHVLFVYDVIYARENIYLSDVRISFVCFKMILMTRHSKHASIKVNAKIRKHKIWVDNKPYSPKLRSSYDKIRT